MVAEEAARTHYRQIDMSQEAQERRWQGRARRYGWEGLTRKTSKSGYVQVLVDTPLGKRWRPEHRVVMEQVLGRPLRAGETVRHRNGKRADNRSENLLVTLGLGPSGPRSIPASALVCPHCGKGYAEPVERT